MISPFLSLKALALRALGCLAGCPRHASVSQMLCPGVWAGHLQPGVIRMRLMRMRYCSSVAPTLPALLQPAPAIMSLPWLVVYLGSLAKNRAISQEVNQSDVHAATPVSSCWLVPKQK
ncbi:unnamed protein product [Polarella glacialis]|uniref:Secreted protein n=1 Tax=Polarella glacialis TaxID=89957 RepID=A0A813LW28_POLGL|nr:unnamed protein product [Polarella glacialis]